MNRDLTVNLRLTAATGENARVASDVINTVNRVREAMTAAAKAAEAIGTSTVQMGASARTAATGLDTLRSKVSETTKAANDASTAVNNLTSAVTSINGVVLAGANAWTSATRQILSGVAAWTSAKDTVFSVSQAFEKIQGMRQYSTAIGPTPSWMNMYDSAIGPERRGIGNQYTSAIGPVPFSQLSGQEVLDFVKRTSLEDNRRNWWRTPPRPGLQTNDGMFEGGANFIGPVRPTGQMGPFETPEFMSARYAEREAERQRQIEARSEAERQAEVTTRRLAAADREYLEGVSRVINGVTSLARSVVLLTAANEEDAAAMLRMIARFEAVAQSVNGVIGVVQGATKAWQQYALAAELAGGSATAGGFMARLGGTGAAVASVLGAGAGLAGGAALAIEGVSDYFTGDGRSSSGDFIANSFGSFAGMFGTEAAGSLFAPYARMNYNQQVTSRMLSAGSQRAASILQRDRYLVNQFQQQQSLYGADFSSQYTMAGIGLEGGARGIATAEAGLAAVRARRGEIGNIDETSSLGLQAEQRSAVRQLLEQEMQLELQRNEARMQAAQEEIQTARQRLSIAQQEAEVARQRLGMIRTGLSGMNPGEQRELIQAVDRADRGENLNLRDRTAIRRAGLRGYDDVIQRSEEADISRNPRLAEIYAREQGINRPIEANVKAQSELVIKLEQNLETQKPVWQAEILAFLEKQAIDIREALKAEMEAGFRAAEERSRLSRRASEGGGGGGGPMMGSF